MSIDCTTLPEGYALFQGKALLQIPNEQIMIVHSTNYSRSTLQWQNLAMLQQAFNISTTTTAYSDKLQEN